MGMNGKELAAAVALVHRRTGTGQEFRETLVPVADGILARLGLTAEEFAVLIVADRHRGRPPLTVTGPVPATPAEDQRVAEAAAELATAELADQQALDRRLVADAAVQEAWRRGKEPAALREKARAALEEWKVAREVLQRATVRYGEAERARNYRRSVLA